MTKQKRAYCFDFDHTVFDTDFFFFGKVKTIFLSKGVSEKNWEKSYHKAKKPCYSLTSHLRELKASTNDKIQYTDIEQEIVQLSANMEMFLFPDVINTLDRIKKSAMTECHIISFGDVGWQGFKIESSNLMYFCHGIHITPKEFSKGHFLKDMVSSGYEINVIDNHPHELDIIREQFSKRHAKINTYLIDRAYAHEYNREKPWEFKEASQISNICPKYRHQMIHSLDQLWAGKSSVQTF